MELATPWWPGDAVRSDELKDGDLFVAQWGACQVLGLKVSTDMETAVALLRILSGRPCELPELALLYVIGPLVRRLSGPFTLEPPARDSGVALEITDASTPAIYGSLGIYKGEVAVTTPALAGAPEGARAHFSLKTGKQVMGRADYRLSGWRLLRGVPKQAVELHRFA